MYDSNMETLWETKSSGKGVGNAVLIMQDDGNLVLYDEKYKVRVER